MSCSGTNPRRRWSQRTRPHPNCPTLTRLAPDPGSTHPWYLTGGGKIGSRMREERGDIVTVLWQRRGRGRRRMPRMLSWTESREPALRDRKLHPLLFPRPHPRPHPLPFHRSHPLRPLFLHGTTRVMSLRRHRQCHLCSQSETTRAGVRLGPPHPSTHRPHPLHSLSPRCRMGIVPRHTN